MATIIVGAIVLTVSVLAARKLYMDKKNGKGCSGCSGCAGSCSGCHTENTCSNHE